MPSTAGWKRRCVGCLPILLAVLALPGCSDSSGSASAPQRGGGASSEAAAVEEEGIAVAVQPAAEQAISSLYVTSATLRAERRATVTARTRGVIEELLVEEGDRVRAGQALAVLENDEQEIELQRAVTARDTKRREYERAARLHQQGLLSEEEHERIRREAEETRIAAALAELELQRTVIHAPFDGRVLERHLDVGANVSDGTAMYDLADLDPLFADVQVPERQIGRLAPGKRVRLVSDAEGVAVQARVERIAPLVDTTTGTVKVTLAVDDAPALRPGSFVRVEIVTDTRPAALVVPRSALVAEGRRWHLFRVQQGKAEQLEIERGYEEGDRVEVRRTVGDTTPLASGDPVVVRGASALSDGSAIRVVGAEASDAAVAEGDRVAS